MQWKEVGDEAEERVIVGSLELYSEQAVDRMVASGMENFGARRFH